MQMLRSGPLARSGSRGRSPSRLFVFSL